MAPSNLFTFLHFIYFYFIFLSSLSSFESCNSLATSLFFFCFLNNYGPSTFWHYPRIAFIYTRWQYLCISSFHNCRQSLWCHSLFRTNKLLSQESDCKWISISLYIYIYYLVNFHLHLVFIYLFISLLYPYLNNYFIFLFFIYFMLFLMFLIWLILTIFNYKFYRHNLLIIS